MNICTFKERTLKSIFKLEDLASTIHNRLLHQPQEMPEMADTIDIGFDSFLEAVYNYLKSWVSPYVEESYEYITGCAEECENSEEKCARLYARTDKIKELLDLINYRLKKIAEEFGLEYDGEFESPDSFPGYIKEMVKLENEFSLALGLAYLIVEFLDGASCEEPCNDKKIGSPYSEEPEVYSGDRDVGHGEVKSAVKNYCDRFKDNLKTVVDQRNEAIESSKDLKIELAKVEADRDAKEAELFELRDAYESAIRDRDIQLKAGYKKINDLETLVLKQQCEISRLKNHNAKLEDKTLELQNPPKKKSGKKIEE